MGRWDELDDCGFAPIVYACSIVTHARGHPELDAKTKFDKVLERATALCDLHERLETHGVPGADEVANLSLDDLLRSALMLGVSGMDAYYRDKFVERLVPYTKKYGPQKVLESALEKAGVTMTDILPLLGNPRPHRTLRNRIADWLARKPMHDLDKIDTLFQGFGLPNLTENAAKKDGAKTINNLVKIAVQRRHDIAHYGDYHTGKNVLKNIKRKWTRQQLNRIQRLVNESEAIITSATS